MATPIKDRKGGLQLPQDYKRVIVDHVRIWTFNGTRSLNEWPGVTNWIKGMARVGHNKLAREGRVAPRSKKQ